MKKLLSLLLTIAMLSTLLVGCGSLTSASSSNTPASPASSAPDTADEEKTPQTDAVLADTVTLGIGSDPESFNPWLAADDARQQVYYNTIYEPLARLTFEGEREMVLAKRVEPSGTGCYEIELYDYIYDTAGNQITASDVIFSFEKCNEVGQLTWATRYLDHFEQTGDFTLLMYVQDESAVALDMLLKTVFIVSEASYNASSDGFATTPVGTGPYTLTSYVPGSSVSLAARDDYWQVDDSLISTAARLGSVKTIDYKVITDTAQMTLALEMGEIDCAAGMGISNTDYSNFMDEDRNALDGYNVVSFLGALIYHLEFNCGEYSALQDQTLREAVCYAIDLDAIVANVLGSDGRACHTNSSPYYNDYDPALEEQTPYAYNPDKAKELLAEAGYGEGELSLTLLTLNADTNCTKALELVQAYLNAVGIDAETLMYDAALYNTTRTDPVGDKWDICLNCVMGLNSTGRLGVLDKNAYSTGMNGLYLDDSTLQDLYMQANLAATYSPETVTELLNYVQENCYLYPLFYSIGYTITTDNITDIVLDRNCALIPGASTIYAN